MKHVHVKKGLKDNIVKLWHLPSQGDPLDWVSTACRLLGLSIALHLLSTDGHLYCSLASPGDLILCAHGLLTRHCPAPEPPAIRSHSQASDTGFTQSLLTLQAAVAVHMLSTGACIGFVTHLLSRGRIVEQVTSVSLLELLLALDAKAMRQSGFSSFPSGPWSPCQSFPETALSAHMPGVNEHSNRVRSSRWHRQLHVCYSSAVREPQRRSWDTCT